MSSYKSLISQIVDGQAVNAANTNTPIQQVQGNTDYLKELVEAAFLGETVFARDRTVNSNVSVGQPVYYSSATQQFELAQAAVTADTLGQLQPAESSNVWGIVYSKSNSTLATILLHGYAEVDLSNTIDETIVPGLYYLSMGGAGKLRLQQQPLPIPVCLVAGEGSTSGTYEVYVNTSLSNSLDSHKHYQFELQCVPAGSVTTTDPEDSSDSYTFVTTDTDKEGWLPASHISFGGLAPTGAKFGYNIAASDLALLWPPIPSGNAYLEWNRGADATVLGMGVPQGTEESDLVIIDTNGIWWLSDCTADSPWLDPEVSTSLAPADTCPRTPDMKMILWFTRATFWTGNSAVLTLTPKAGSGLTITCSDSGEDATSGNLIIDHDMSLLVTETGATGHLALKSISGAALSQGPVVEALKAGVGISLTSSLGTLPDSGYAQGVVTVTGLSNIDASELPVETIRLDGAEEGFYAGLVGVVFPADAISEFTGRIRVPQRQALTAGTTAKLRFTLMGRGVGTIPADAFTLTYRRLLKPSAILTAVALPLVATSLTLNTGITLTAANQYFQAESAEFTIADGDIITFTIGRIDDTYNFDIYALQKHAVIVEA